VDAPLSSGQLSRVARRAGLGLARMGSVAHHGSGEIFVAFATEGRQDRAARDVGARPAVADGLMNEVFPAVVEATEEAVLNALWAAESMEGRDGYRCPALPHDEVLALLRAADAIG
jgi:D-aminopeptidase